jgi:hypothetical protein
VTLLWALYARLQKYEFFRWWAWAWTAFAVFLLTATVSLRVGPTWTPEKSALVLVLLLSGYLEPALLVFGGLSWRSPGKISRRVFWWGIALSVGTALVCFATSVALRQSPLLSFAIRNVPRTLVLAPPYCFVAACSGWNFAGADRMRLPSREFFAFPTLLIRFSIF